MKKLSLILFLGVLMVLQGVNAQCIPGSVRPVTGVVSGSTGTFNFNNIPTGNVIQINSPAANTFYEISLCATNPANSPDGLNDSYLTILTANSAAASSLSFADDGCTTNVPNGWGPTTMNFTAPAAGTYFIYLTEYNAAGSAFCIADGVNNAYQMEVIITGTPPVCDAGTLTSPTTQTVCTNQTGTIAVTGNSTVGDYTLGFVPGPTGTGGNTVGFSITGITTLPYTFDDDVNGILSFNGLPPLQGEWILTLYAVDGVGNICDSTGTTSVSFLDISNPLCGGTGYDVAMISGSISEYTLIPFTEVASFTPRCEIANFGQNAATGISVQATIRDGSNATVYTSTLTQGTILPDDTLFLNAPTSYTPPSVQEIYTIEFIVSINENDGNVSNDTVYGGLFVNDSLYARDLTYLSTLPEIDDRGAGNFGLGVGGTFELGNVYELTSPADLVRVEAFFAQGSFAIGDTIIGRVYNFSGNTVGSQIAINEIIITANDTFGVVDFVFNQALTPGQYFVTVEETATMDNMAMFHTADVYTTNRSLGSINGGAFQDMGVLTGNAFKVVPLIRAVLDVQTSCSITDLAPGTTSACNTSNNTYTQEVIVTYTNPPATGMLNVNGEMFAIGSSPQTVTLTNLNSDGLPVDVTAVFTNDPSCTYTETAVFTAPSSCVTCEAGTLTSSLTQVVCPSQVATIASAGATTVGDYEIGFDPGLTGAGGPNAAFSIGGIAALPYTFDDDINGVLSFNSLPPLTGEWIVTLYSIDASGNRCDSTATTSVTFAAANDPLCGGGTTYDAAVTDGFISQYSSTPLSQVVPLTPSCDVSNNGTSAVTGVAVTTTITDGANAVVYTSTMNQASLAAGGTTTLTAGSTFTPSASDLYIVEFVVSITENDVVATNDTFVTAFVVEDSLYARDFFYLTGDVNLLDGPWGFGAGVNAQLGNVYSAEANAELVSVTGVLSGALQIGDQTQANLYAMSGATPGALIASSAVLTVSAADTPVIFYDFVFPANTNLVAGNDYLLTIQQNAASGANFALYSSAEIFTPNTSFFQANGGAWSAIETSVIGNQTFMVRANVYVPPVVNCAITDVSAATQTACNPGNNSYTQQVVVTYANPPATGMLNVNGQMFPITSSPQTVTLTSLNADGLPVDVTATFTANTACTYTETAVFTAPANCLPVCAITDISAGSQTPCVNTSNLYTQEVTVTYSTPPATGMLNVNGQMFAITSSPQTVTLTGLNSDGLAVDVIALFTANAACTYSENAVFTAPAGCLCPTITVNVNTTSNSNCSTPNGTATAVPSGGVGPYTYSWTPSTFGSGSTITGLPSGTYTVQVLDANLCPGSGSGNVANTSGVNAVVGSVQNATCSSSADGLISINATGGTAPITYTWSDQGFPTSISSRNNLPAGSYTVVVEDAGNCSVTLGPIVIAAPSPVSVVLNAQNNVSCNGGSDGTIDMGVTGGTMPYDYSWTNSTAITQDLSNLAAGTYQLTVVDGNACPAVVGPQVTITEPAAINISVLNVQDATCSAAGSIDISVTGGTPVYTYNWGTGNPNSESLASAPAGTYQLIVTDANLCTASSQNITVNAAPSISLAVSSTAESTAGAADGSATVVPSGGTPPFTYAWDDPSGQSSATATNLSAGTYNVVVTDSADCSETIGVVVDLANGIRELNLSNLQVFPNPTQKEVTISFSASKMQDFDVSLYSPIGNVIFTDKATQTNSYERTYDLSSLAAGIYFIEISNGEGKTLRKLTVLN